MESAHTIQDKPGTPGHAAVTAASSTRTCLVTGEDLPKDELVRFVVGPDNSIVPDLAQNLPGRGLWVKAAREAITTAARKDLFSKAAKASVKADPNLADLVENLLRKRCFDFMGLARGAGVAILGQTQVEAALRAGQLDTLLLANDASDRPDNKGAVKEYSCFTRTELGVTFGYDQIVYAGFKAHKLVEKLKIELARLEKTATPNHIIQGNG